MLQSYAGQSHKATKNVEKKKQPKDRYILQGLSGMEVEVVSFIMYW